VTDTTVYVIKAGVNEKLLITMLASLGYGKKSIFVFKDIQQVLGHSLEKPEHKLVFVGEAVWGAQSVEPELKRIAQEFPCLIVSERHKPRLAKKFLEMGIQDVIVMGDVSKNQLEKTMGNAVERHELRDKLRELSEIDSLTGLYNHRGFLKFAEPQISLAVRLKKPVSLMYIDINNMKWTNDSWGHAEGDCLITETAALLNHAFRRTDVIGRLGGDEFAVLSLQNEDGGTIPMEDRLKRSLARRITTWDKPYPLSLSIGTAYIQEAVEGILPKLISDADKEMYRNKKGVRGEPPVE